MNFEDLHQLDKKAYEVLEKARDDYDANDGSVTGWGTLAQLMGITERQLLCGFLLKHISSIVRNKSTRESMEGRYIDAMNYLRLLHKIDSAPREEKNVIWKTRKELEAQVQDSRDWESLIKQIPRPDREYWPLEGII